MEIGLFVSSILLEPDEKYRAKISKIGECPSERCLSIPVPTYTYRTVPKLLIIMKACHILFARVRGLLLVRFIETRIFQSLSVQLGFPVHAIRVYL